MRSRANTPERLTAQTLERLLARLGTHPDTAAREYAALHERLVEYFDRRGSFAADALADRTLDRVAAKLQEDEAIQNVPAFCYGVARNVLHEWERAQAAEGVALAELAARRRVQDAAEDLEAEEACLALCLEELPLPNRELIAAYYQGPGRTYLRERSDLAARLGMTYPALKARAHRIRALLEVCLEGCLKGLRDQ
jgi:DNA-directed RNA polymerase specialized sigma24 family protein